MKIDVTKEWCLKMADLEGDAAISAGPMSVDPQSAAEPPQDAAWQPCAACGTPDACGRWMACVHDVEEF